MSEGFPARVEQLQAEANAYTDRLNGSGERVHAIRNQEFAQRVAAAAHELRVRAEAQRQLAEEQAEGEVWPEADVAAIFAEGLEPDRPLALARSDGAFLVYRGIANVIFGEGGSGKSALLMWASAQEIRAGHPVYVVDYEQTAKKWIDRLVNLGLSQDEITARFSYRDGRKGKRPPKSIEKNAFVVIDSLSAAIESFGLDPNDANSIEMVYRRVVDPFLDADAALVLIDHPGHADKTRPMNSIRKINIIQGAIYRVERVETRPFGRGRTGEALVKLFKDNTGGIGVARNGIVAVFAMTSNEHGRAMVCALRPPDLSTLYAVAESTPKKGPKRAAAADCQAEIMDALRLTGVDMTTKELKLATGRGNDTLKAALEALVTARKVTRRTVKGTHHYGLPDA